MNRGLFTLKEILAEGISRHQLEKWVAEEKMAHVGYGWYATEEADARCIVAARAGTRLGCVTACDIHGLWLPNTNSELHVLAGLGESREDVRRRVSSASKGLYEPIVHRAAGRKTELICPVEEAIEQVARCSDSELALVVLESALNLEVVDVTWVEAMIERLPRRLRNPLEGFSALSESGSETRVAHMLRDRGLTVHQQVPLFRNPYERVDLVVGHSWVIECDSATHHSSITTYEADRSRDLYLQSLGFQVTRLSYEQIWSLWPETQLQLHSIIAQRRYRKRAQLDPARIPTNQ